MEYTQKSDFIRQADQSLEQYPDVVAQLRQLYDQKQKAQNTVIILKRTVHLITRAKENLAKRYHLYEGIHKTLRLVYLTATCISG